MASSSATGSDSGECIPQPLPGAVAGAQRKLGVGQGCFDSRASVPLRAWIPEVQESYICSPTVTLGRKAGSPLALATAKRMPRMCRNKRTLNLSEGEGQGELG